MTDQDLQRSFLIACLAPQRGESILDLGCGTGKELEQILALRRGTRVVGIDNSERMLQGARARLSRYIDRGTAELVAGDAGQRLPFPSKSFDAVFSADLMECLPAAKQAHLLREIRRVLKPGGRVLVEHTDWDTQVWNAMTGRSNASLCMPSATGHRAGWKPRTDGWGAGFTGFSGNRSSTRECKLVLTC